jgi:hypothetical protein
LHAIRLSRNIYFYDWILPTFDNTKLARIASCVFLLADDNVKDEVTLRKNSWRLLSRKCVAYVHRTYVGRAKMIHRPALGGIHGSG